jgi:hypothetical protein
MKPRAALLGLALMLVSNTTFALMHTIWANLEFGFSFEPGDGAFLTLDGPAWSVDPQVTFVTESTGTFLKVTYTEDDTGALPTGVAAFPTMDACNFDCGNALAFIPLTGPPHNAGDIQKVMIETIPEPSVSGFLLGMLGAGLLFRALRAIR